MVEIVLVLEYAQVNKMLGNGRLEANCFDGISRLCHIRGKLRKKVWTIQCYFLATNPDHAIIIVF